MIGKASLCAPITSGKCPQFSSLFPLLLLSVCVWFVPGFCTRQHRPSGHMELELQRAVGRHDTCVLYMKVRPSGRAAMFISREPPLQATLFSLLQSSLGTFYGFILRSIPFPSVFVLIRQPYSFFLIPSLYLVIFETLSFLLHLEAGTAAKFYSYPPCELGHGTKILNFLSLCKKKNAATLTRVTLKAGLLSPESMMLA